MSYSREYIGTVKVKSGKLVLADPENIKAQSNYIADKATAAVSNDESGGEIGKNGIAVAFETPYRDGDYPVFISKNDKGDITSVEIQLAETEP